MNKPICFKLEDDDGNMVEYSLPSRWAICDRCEGNGTHDHPAFSNGISNETFAEDPDFREEYFAGRYDVACTVCKGKGKVLVPDERQFDEEQKKLFERYEEMLADDARERRADAYTRRMENGGY